jgi:hypothetical protein
MEYVTDSEDVFGQWRSILENNTYEGEKEKNMEDSVRRRNYTRLRH